MLCLSSAWLQASEKEHIGLNYGECVDMEWKVTFKKARLTDTVLLFCSQQVWMK
jgi:hypothetical protein